MSRLGIDKYGIKYWRNKKGELHREDGPAIEHINGTKCWYINNNRHRLDGPAVEYADGYKAWYLDNKYIDVKSQKEFEQYLRFKLFI